MHLRALTLAAAIVAASAFGANAQSSSSNPTMAPTAPGTTKVEAPGKSAKKTKKTKAPKADSSESSSTPSMAPTGAGSKGKTENLGKNTKGGAKQSPDTPGQSSSTPSMAPTK